MEEYGVTGGRDLPARWQGGAARRRTDWQVGCIVYQVIVDRFAPSRRLDSKREHYAAPRMLREWGQKPSRGKYLEEVRNREGELEFWGGDLESVRQSLDYVADLSVELLYLNPIFEAYTNHKYDATDYHRIDPQYGTFEELRALADDVHRRGMRLMLDGVFNHCGRRHPEFVKALADPKGEAAGQFHLDERFPNGYRSWRNVQNLPEWNLENPAVREAMWEKPGSVVQRYLAEAHIDGWRLDVAPDLGYEYLRALTDAAHGVRADSVVIGECWNYPEEWMRVVDGILNMHARSIILELVEGRIAPQLAGRMLERMVQDAGIDGLLRSHMVLDNHDVPRLATIVPGKRGRRLARILQFTLPGCPVIYYGTELGMEGGADPGNRAPMRWDLANDGNDELELTRDLIRLREEAPALRIGDFRLMESDTLLAFARLTDRARESVLVVVNPGSEPQRGLVAVRDSRLMDSDSLHCPLSGEKTEVHCGMLDVTIGARDARVFRFINSGESFRYDMLKRIP